MKRYQCVIALCLACVSLTSYADQEDLNNLQQQIQDW